MKTVIFTLLLTITPWHCSIRKPEKKEQPKKEQKEKKEYYGPTALA